MGVTMNILPAKKREAMRKGFFIRSTVVVLFFCCILVVSAQSLYEVTAPKTLNIRNSPNIKSRIIGKLYHGDIVEVEKFVGGWAAFNYKDKTAYVSSRYLREKVTEQPVVVESEPEPLTMAVDSSMTNEIYEESSLLDIEMLNSTVDTDDSSSNSFKSWKFQFGAEVLAGYSNFHWNDGSPKSGLGFGGGAYLDLIAPKFYYASAYLGYNRKGSGAYPMDYITAKLYPLGFRYPISKSISLHAKVGGYVGYSFSDIEYHDSKLDYGLIGAIGAEYGRFGISVSYEHGIPNVSESDVRLHNRNIFLTISYQLLTF